MHEWQRETLRERTVSRGKTLSCVPPETMFGETPWLRPDGDA
jgi:hypothetical protein